MPRSRLLLLFVSLACVSAAMPLHGGHFGVDAIVLVSVGFVASLVALLGVEFGKVPENGIAWAARIVLLLQATFMIVYRPAAYAPAGISHVGFYALLGLFLVAALLTMVTGQIGRRHKSQLLLGTFILCGAWVLRHSPNPFIDTFTVHQESCNALMRGKNPYGIHVTNLYGADGTKWLPPEFVTTEKMLFGYPYPPVTLLLSMPGYVALGDARWSMLAAVGVAGALMAWMHRGATALMAAAIFLSFSRIFEVLESSWSETYLVMLLAGCAFAATRKSRLLPWLVGLLLVSKQYLLLMAPATLLLLPWPLKWKDVVAFYSRAAIAGVVVTVPFIITHFDGFWAGVVKMHLAARPRDDSLSFSAFFNASQWGGVASKIAFLACFLTQVIGLKFAPRSAFGFALTIATAAFALFIVGKGFMNYYFFIFGATCCALAAAQVEHADTTRTGSLVASTSAPA